MEYIFKTKITQGICVMKSSKIGLLLGALLLSAQVFADHSAVGLWRNIDDQTGFSKGLIRIYQNDDGTYSGKVADITPHPGYTPKEICDKCPGADRNKPIIGMTILRNFKISPTNPLEYAGGMILDPTSGKLYKSKLRLNSTGKRLSLRGYVGVELIGRSQTWIRVE